MDSIVSLGLLPAALVLDLLLGDPLWLPHPVRWMGRAIEWAEPRFRCLTVSPILSGGIFAAALVSGAWLLTFVFLHAAAALSPAVGTVMGIILLYYCLSARGLADAAAHVLISLETEGLAAARGKLAMIVGRDVNALDAAGIRRALVETVAENFVDGVVSPLFYAALGGAPLAVAYKMVNTLDSMVGYKNKRYADFGKVSARLDDVANYLPARLSAPVIALAVRLLGGRSGRCLKTAFKEGRRHTSPNAGYPEAAFAGALGVRLNGPNTYGGRLVEKPWIGAGFGDPDPQHVRRAAELMWLASLLWLGCCLTFQAALLWGKAF
jgi:adenosylcobinamide-phosphate synthase